MSLDLSRWLLSGFLATLSMTTLVALAQGLHLTRMSLPWMLGSIVTDDRDRAKIIGTGLHFLNGWLFSLIYVLVLARWNGGWMMGVGLGLLHAFFVLAVLLPMLPVAHPRMADSRSGPNARRRLEPPGFLALHYGYQTPLVVVVSHLVFGFLLGWLNASGLEHP